jgi:hypothetical protein
VGWLRFAFELRPWPPPSILAEPKSATHRRGACTQDCMCLKKQARLKLQGCTSPRLRSATWRWCTSHAEHSTCSSDSSRRQLGWAMTQPWTDRGHRMRLDAHPLRSRGLPPHVAGTGMVRLAPLTRFVRHQRRKTQAGRARLAERNVDYPERGLFSCGCATHGLLDEIMYCGLAPAQAAGRHLTIHSRHLYVHLQTMDQQALPRHYLGSRSRWLAIFLYVEEEQ